MASRTTGDKRPGMSPGRNDDARPALQRGAVQRREVRAAQGVQAGEVAGGVERAARTRVGSPDEHGLAFELRVTQGRAAWQFCEGGRCSATV